ncbi:MAG TPA: hypothetical protein VEC15_05740 [Actinomycetota bacterium]|nr:hypothetical protein [Actinomycetota bacterium]
MRRVILALTAGLAISIAVPAGAAGSGGEARVGEEVRGPTWVAHTTPIVSGPDRPGLTSRGPTAVVAPWRAAPSMSSAFDAIGRQGPRWPADPTGALGEQWLLTAVNSSYALYDLNGHPVIGPNGLASLFPVPRGTRVSDPEVVYDQYDDRFVLAYVATDDGARRSWIYVVTVPDATATTPSTWCGTEIVADRTARDGRQFADDLGLGYSRDHVAITADMNDFGGRFRGASVLVFPKGRLYDCDRRPAYATFTGRETKSPTGARASSIQPAVTVGEGRSLYLTSIDAGRPTFLILWRLTGTGTDVALREVALRIPTARRPPPGTQGGGGLDAPDTWWDTGDGRLVSTFADLDSGKVYTAHVVRKDLAPDSGAPYEESVVRWYDVDPAGALGRSRVARIGTIGAPQTDAGWPSLATDVAGNLFVTYSRASAITGEFLSAWIAEVPVGTNEATSVLLRAGTARLQAARGLEPWGEHTAMSRDPVDGRFVAAVNQIAVVDGSETTRDWQQIVAVVSDGP